MGDEEIGKLIIKLNLDVKDLKKDVKESKESVDGLKVAFKTSFMELNAAKEVAVSAFQAIQGAIDATVGKYSEYASQVEQFARITGMSADESSRVIQTADDMQVGVETLTASLRIAVQNGFVPTIDNLAKLADKYQATIDPAARADMMSKTFGRSWTEIAPMFDKGGQAIRDNAESISEHMIVTDEAVRKNILYKKTLDDWGDSLTELTNQIGSSALPTLTYLIQLTNKSIGTFREQEDAWKGNISGIGVLRAAIADFIPAERVFTAVVAGTTKVQDDATAALLKDGSAAKEWMSDRREAMHAGVVAIDGYEAKLQDLSKYSAQEIADMKIQANSQSRISMQYYEQARAVKTVVNHYQELKTVLDETTVAQKDLIAATNDLATKEEDWKQSTGESIGAQLESRLGATEKMRKALEVIDKVEGTNLLTQQKQKEATQKLMDEYARTGNIANFETGLKNLNQTFMDMDPQIANAKAKLKELQDAINALKSRTITITAEIGSGPGAESREVAPNNAEEARKKAQSGGASGLDMIVPNRPQFENDRYIIRASAGEHVKIDRTGMDEKNGREPRQSIYSTNMGGITINLHGATARQGKQVAREILGELKARGVHV